MHTLSYTRAHMRPTCLKQLHMLDGRFVLRVDSTILVSRTTPASTLYTALVLWCCECKELLVAAHCNHPLCTMTRYWAVALPAYFVVTYILVFVSYAGINLLNTPSLESFDTLVGTTAPQWFACLCSDFQQLW